MTTRLLNRLNPILVVCSLLVSLGAIPAWAIETITYLHTDIAGSPVAATDASGNIIWRESYRPYGERTNNQPASASNRQFFHDKPFDQDTGLSYFGARYYDPVVGRFMGVDPKGFDENNPHSFNRFAYGNNNPYRYTDPDGKGTLAMVLVGGVLFAGAIINATNPKLAAQISKKLWNVLHNEAQEPSDAPGDKGKSQEPKTEGASGGDKDPSTPTGRRGSPLDVPKGTNEDANIGGREYGGHALDQMQGRGVPPSAVEDAIRNGQQSPGNKPGRTVHTGSDGLTVVTEGGRVVTVINK